MNKKCIFTITYKCIHILMQGVKSSPKMPSGYGKGERVNVQIYSFLKSAPDVVDNEPHALTTLLLRKSPATRFTIDWVIYSAGQDGLGE
jgi:hypothetical protein